METQATRHNGCVAPPGFRLDRLEVRNWGTFHDKIHVLDPVGQTALLLGENGSGKSTLVDALLTLLVPRTKRSYNLSAGGAKKRERDEKTYVLGAYGSESKSEEARAETKVLRKAGDPPSILLALFKNSATRDVVTLAQVMWIHDGEVRHLYLIARRECCIKTDFGGLGDSRTWKKAFRNKGFEVDETFPPYAEKLVRHLRMESTTTLALFSQTVAIKEITHVSGFIRDHMLEKLDTRELVDRLEHHYEDLKHCWEAIRRAKEQLRLLAPVVDKVGEIGRIDDQVSATTRLRDALPACFAARLKVLLEREQTGLRVQIQALTGEIDALTTMGRNLAQMDLALSQAIDNDEVGKQLTLVQQQLEETSMAESRRRGLCTQYHQCVAEVGLSEEVVTEARFLELQGWAEQEQQNQGGQIVAAATEKAAAEQEFKRISAQYNQLKDELVSLRSRVDLIPENHRQIRHVIARGAGVDEGELPFAGELMDVKQEFQTQWRGALERLLRSFGLSVLVPEHLYGQVNRFINENNLRARVVYHRVPKVSPFVQATHDTGRVIQRMRLKEGHPLARWVEGELRTHFNYRCCETIEEFENSTGFALTKQGLIRSAGTRHIKDDTSAINDARSHILGWSNREKIRGIEEEQRKLAVAAQVQAQIVDEAGRRQQAATRRATQTAKLQGYRSFTEIDWRSSALKREELELQRRELEQSSDKIRKLQDQRDELRRQIAGVDAKKTEIAGIRGNLQGREQEVVSRLASCNTILAVSDHGDLSLFEPALLDLVSDDVFTIHQAAALESRAIKAVNDKLLALQSERGKAVSSIVRSMANFLNEFPDLKSDLSAGEEYMAEFQRVEEAVRRDDLPRHDQKFHDLMSRDVLVHVVKFQDALDGHCEEIQSKLDHLNVALKSIEYSSRTYITIRATTTHDSDIRSFRGRLRGCLDHGLAPDNAARETAFQRISDLIDTLRAKPEWTAKVTDTRNWLAFAVEERDRETGAQENIYEDTSGKSGGQKAKLAFTILASAVAYQYGIAKDRQNAQSFRFVVVDEMFSRSDEANSRYALRLFAQFHLQLLIVCPFDARARVVEPFVSSYHLVLNPTTQYSTVRTVSVEEVNEHLSQQSLSPVHNANTRTDP